MWEWKARKEPNVEEDVEDALDNVKVNDEKFDDDVEMAANEVDDDKAVVVTNADNFGKQEDIGVRPTFPVLQVS